MNSVVLVERQGSCALVRIVRLQKIDRRDNMICTVHLNRLVDENTPLEQSTIETCRQEAYKYQKVTKISCDIESRFEASWLDCVTKGGVVDRQKTTPPYETRGASETKFLRTDFTAETWRVLWLSVTNVTQYYRLASFLKKEKMKSYNKEEGCGKLPSATPQEDLGTHAHAQLVFQADRRELLRKSYSVLCVTEASLFSKQCSSDCRRGWRFCRLTPASARDCDLAWLWRCTLVSRYKADVLSDKEKGPKWMTTCCCFALTSQ